MFTNHPTLATPSTTRRRFWAGLAIATLCIANYAQETGATAPSSTQKARVVIQVSDNDAGKWNLALNNARNLQADLGADKVEIEVVVYGPGIDMLKLESTASSRVGEALKAGVAIVACENTMKGQKLTRPDMLPNISYVPAGVTELVRKQGMGWAYIRP
jgi:uncharacterized protein